MIIGRSYLLFSIVCISFLCLGSANSVFAVDYEILNEASCKNLPGQGQNENWNAGTSTCTKNSNLNILAADTLTIPNGVTLVMPSNDDIRNDGVITNNGIINSFRGDINNRNSGVFTNTGTILLDSTSGNTGRLTNQDFATFTNTISGSITLDGIAGNNNNRAQLRNQDDGDFTNSGTITISGDTNNAGQLRNQVDAIFTNSGIISISGTDNNSGRLWNQNDAEFTNSATITISGTNDNSGRLRNQVDAVFTNSGTITISGTNDNSGRLHNQNDGVITNSATITILGTNDNSGQLRNQNNGLIVNNCGEITFVSIVGNPIQEGTCPIISSSSGSSSAYEDPTIGKSSNGKQVVENGICIDINCWTVTADYHQDFELVEMLTDSTHTITTTVFCQNGVNKCNYVAFGVSPYGTNINDSVWKIILQKDSQNNWTMKVIDNDGYLGEVTSITQIVNDNRFLSASVTIEFKKPTPGMILNVEVRDSGGGYRDFKFNDGVEIIDAYAYPLIETSYESPLEIEPLCLNENPAKRYTCAFDKVRDWTIKNAEKALSQLD